MIPSVACSDERATLPGRPGRRPEASPRPVRMPAAASVFSLVISLLVALSVGAAAGGAWSTCSAFDCGTRARLSPATVCMPPASPPIDSVCTYPSPTVSSPRNGTSTGGSDVAFAIPSGTAAGDLVLLLVHSRNDFVGGEGIVWHNPGRVVRALVLPVAVLTVNTKLLVYYFVADGTEADGLTATVTDPMSYTTYSIRGWGAPPSCTQGLTAEGGYGITIFPDALPYSPPWNTSANPTSFLVAFALIDHTKGDDSPSLRRDPSRLVTAFPAECEAASQAAAPTTPTVGMPTIGTCASPPASAVWDPSAFVVSGLAAWWVARVLAVPACPPIVPPSCSTQLCCGAEFPPPPMPASPPPPTPASPPPPTPPTCADYGDTCPAPRVLKSAPETIVCSGAACTEAECCCVTCAGFNCPILIADKSSMDTIECAGLFCTQMECCFFPCRESGFWPCPPGHVQQGNFCALPPNTDGVLPTCSVEHCCTNEICDDLCKRSGEEECNTWKCADDASCCMVSAPTPTPGSYCPPDYACPLGHDRVLAGLCPGGACLREVCCENEVCVDPCRRQGPLSCSTWDCADDPTCCDSTTPVPTPTAPQPTPLVVTPPLMVVDTVAVIGGPTTLGACSGPVVYSAHISGGDAGAGVSQWRWALEVATRAAPNAFIVLTASQLQAAGTPPLGNVFSVLSRYEFVAGGAEIASYRIMAFADVPIYGNGPVHLEQPILLDPKPKDQLNVTRLVTPAPSLFIEAPSRMERHHIAEARLTLSWGDTASECGDSTSPPALDFAWRITPPLSAPVAEQVDLTTRDLVLPPGTLTAGAYTLTVAVRSTGSQPTSVPLAEAAHSLVVDRSLLRAVIVGSSPRTLGTGDATGLMMLDATASHDPDSLKTALTFSWTCTAAAGGPCVVVATSAELNEPILALNTQSLPVGEWVLTVLVTDAMSASPRFASARVTVIVEAGTVIDVVASWLRTVSGQTAHNPTDILRLTARVPVRAPAPDAGGATGGGPIGGGTVDYGSPVGYVFSWSLVLDGAPFAPGESTILTPNDSPSLAIAANGLPAGALLRVSVTVHEATNSAIRGSAVIDIPVNTPPRGGVCRAEPTAVALLSPVRIWCDSWYDPDGATAAERAQSPLRFDFEYVVAGGDPDTATALTVHRYYPYEDARLPVGEWDVFVTAIDSNGGRSVPARVRVHTLIPDATTPPGGAAPVVCGEADAALARVLALRDRDEFLQLVSVIIESLLIGIDGGAAVCGGATGEMLWDLLFQELEQIAALPHLAPSTIEQLAGVLTALVHRADASGSRAMTPAEFAVVTRIVQAVLSLTAVRPAVASKVTITLASLLASVHCGQLDVVIDLIGLLSHQAVARGAVIGEGSSVDGGDAFDSRTIRVSDERLANLTRPGGLGIIFDAEMLRQAGADDNTVALRTVEYGDAVRRCRPPVDGDVITIDILDPSGNPVSIGGGGAGGGDGVEFDLPIDPETIDNLNKRRRAPECAYKLPECLWWSAESGRWSGDGCSALNAAELVSGASPVAPDARLRCHCSHLTDFAALLHALDACDPGPGGAESSVRLVSALGHAAIVATTVVQLLRMRCSPGARRAGAANTRTAADTVVLFQHVLIALASAGRTIADLSLGGHINVGGVVPLAISVVTPLLLGYWVFTLLIFQWASMHSADLARKATAFTAIRPFLIGTNVAVGVTVLILFGSLAMSGDEARGALATVGALVMALIDGVSGAIFCVAASRVASDLGGAARKARVSDDEDSAATRLARLPRKLRRAGAVVAVAFAGRSASWVLVLVIAAGSSAGVFFLSLSQLCSCIAFVVVLYLYAPAVARMAGAGATASRDRSSGNEMATQPRGSTMRTSAVWTSDNPAGGDNPTGGV